MSGILVLAAAAAAFNLTCTGTVTRIDGTRSPPQEFTSVYRLDLDARKWCESACRTLFDIADIRETSITLVDDDENNPVLGRRTHKSTVNRENGSYLATLTSSFGVTTYKGTCEKSDFTGFPKVETKF